MRFFLSFLTLASLALAQGPAGLRFHANFDDGLNAKSAWGDAKLYSAPSWKEIDKAVEGLGAAPNVELAKGAGRKGSDALRFKAKNTNAVFFKADKNVAFDSKSWDGTISFYLKLNPDKDLAPGFCDPFQLTDKDYNDSALWVDFTKDETPRHFRLGVFGELKVWNPENLAPDKNPAFNNRLVINKTPPFADDKWTHVVITHKALGSGKGEASLYLDGVLFGSTTGISEPFAWDISKATIRLGVNYVGLIDDVQIWSRALTVKDIKKLIK